MSILNFLSKQFADVIEWAEQPGELAIRYPLIDHEVKDGSQLVVRENQVVLFHSEGAIADVLGPGLHTIETANLPILTALMNWGKGFKSPFKSDIYFYSTKEQRGLTWGTAQPVTIHDSKRGPLEIRAFGRYSFCIADVELFAAKLMGSLALLTVADLEPQLRGIIAANIATHLGDGIDCSDLTRGQDALSEHVLAAVRPKFELVGLKCTEFFVENISLPEDTLEHFDHSGPQPTDYAASAGASTEADHYAAIRQLHDLLIAGAITQSEFDAQKVELLARLE